ncbi:actin [Nymphon striatum]|nr:actin [Nymphon striatum]
MSPLSILGVRVQLSGVNTPDTFITATAELMKVQVGGRPRKRDYGQVEEEYIKGSQLLVILASRYGITNFRTFTLAKLAFSINFPIDEAGSQGEDDFFEEDDDDKAEYQHYQYHGIEPEDAGLEVIPEEDEESLDSMCDCPIKGNDYDDEIIKSQRLNQPVDCDSGVTDDQRSNSTGDDLDSLAGDTDSAKGSMAHDVYQTSPTSSLGVGKDLETFESERPIEHKVKVHFQKPKLSVADEVDRIFHPCDLEIAENYPVTQMNSFVSNGIAKENGDSSSLEWDPTKLLKELYSTKYPEIKHTLCDSTQYVNIEGYLEKLPSGRKKATFWNPWKRKYFKAKDGYLYYYESRHSEKEVLSLQLMGGNVDTLDNNMIGVDDGGWGEDQNEVYECKINTTHVIYDNELMYLSKDEVDRWQQALLTHCMENFVLTYVQPVMYGLRSHKDIVVIDLGSCSVRAGVLAEEPTLPQIFFPAVCATNVDTGKRVFGIGALSPSVRKKSIISFPLQPQQSKYTIDIAALPDLLIKVFEDLDIDPKHYQVQLCISRKFSMQTQIAVAQVLFDHFEVDGVNITQQSITALYSYNASSGIIVDIGSRLDILPIIDGYIVESGVTCTPYGGQRICHHLKQALNNKQYSFESNSESYLIRYALEQLCFVAQNYDAEMNNFRMDPDSLEKSVSLIDFHPSQDELSLDSERFCVTEGLFNPELWGLDLKGLHKLVHKAIMECSMDVRKEMTRSIYLCGGVTLIPGFADRLQKEVDKLTPPSLTPKVHSSPYRYHASYIGACILASNDEFQQIMVSSAEWKQSGNACLSKWHL